ncbi:hypothetical protein BAUCODRAFT_487083 [Baudoinia panamericana UAMH 10762]|uniref:FZ domain-containing protein n=1 Tax=Baudoinia panamericana (strain UAMH 10762) TaxID=717646 RepID=M2MJ72_BAUPA|nr:uncharacterized protein BAUCODRAFT_487083 [Baudoinia panamericana UAMH 10762]EMC96726.1 hypothetical protein BAUCODRAFT_487083 [Baudoinia panamericana UAMH 10762]
MLLQCPKLTPLQSRFVASFGTLLLLGLVYWSLSNPHFAYAAELGLDGSGRPRDSEDHIRHGTEQNRLAEDGIEPLSVDEDDRVVERAAVASAISANNAPNQLNIQPSNTTLWVYSQDLLQQAAAPAFSGLPSDPSVKRDLLEQHSDLRRRQDGKTIYISINTCLQPNWNASSVQTGEPPQLTLYVGAASDNSDLGPNGQNQIVQPLMEGFANVSVNANSGTWYIAVSAPALTENYVGVWNYELAVSTDDYYHSADLGDPFLYLVDTDMTAALLVTNNLTQQNASTDVFQEWMHLSPPPFIMFATDADNMGMAGLRNSYCGWSSHQPIAGSQQDTAGRDTNVQMGMITRGLGNKPKEQFYITDLNPSSGYVGVLAQPGNSTKSGSGVVGGGGKIWKPVAWQTKADGNCAMMFNLSFCDEVAYAVPSNTEKYNITQLRDLYDSNTQASYQNFSYSLQQIPCETSADSQYSTVKTCDDCAAAYKEWLCAVSIPRCEDFTNPAPWLQMRNVAQPYYNNNTLLPPDFLNASYTPMPRAPTLEGSPAYNQTYWTALATRSSRNPGLIVDLIQPGPYKEVLPCEDLCYGLVQSCPASLGFGCPYKGRGLEAGYGQRSPNGTITCSYLGAVYDVNSAPDVLAPAFKAIAIAALVALVVGVA